MTGCRWVRDVHDETVPCHDGLDSEAASELNALLARGVGPPEPRLAARRVAEHDRAAIGRRADLDRICDDRLRHGMADAIAAIEACPSNVASYSKRSPAHDKNTSGLPNGVDGTISTALPPDASAIQTAVRTSRRDVTSRVRDASRSMPYSSTGRS